ncbi:MAG TPA: hypothetical protein VNT42_05105 [Sphingomonas sp.]|nr:hypothetical protein [Sphingomonas sp.]
MGAVFKGVIASAFLAGSSLAVTAPAHAGDRTATAIIAGIIGLGVGAAIASDNHRDRYESYGYDAGPTGYYTAQPYYGYGYQQPYYSGGYGYERGYYRGGDRYRNERRHERHNGYGNGHDNGHDWDRRDRDDYRR